MAARLTFEFDGLDPVVVELPLDKAALITDEFIEAYDGPVDGKPAEKLSFLVNKLKQYVIETAASNYAKKAQQQAFESANKAVEKLMAI